MRPAAALALFCLLLAPQAGAEQPYRPSHPDPVLESWRWQTFPELNGLGLRCLAQAADGAMWFGTYEGAMRYDGMHWTSYTPEDGLLSAPVNFLLGARDGSVYAGTEMGLCRFGEGAWTKVFPPVDALPWPVETLIEAGDGSIWAGTAWGALHIAGERQALFTTETLAATLRTIAPQVQVSIVPERVASTRPWSRANRQGIGIRVVEGEWIGINRGNAPKVICEVAPGSPGEAAGLKVGDRIVTVNGRRLAFLNSGLLGAPGSTVALTVQREGRADPLAINVARGPVEGTYGHFSVGHVFEDRTGALWFGVSDVFGSAVVRCSKAAGGPAWQRYTEADGLQTDYGPKTIQTQDGTIWAISQGGRAGAGRFDGRTWTHTGLQDMDGSNANSSLLQTGDGTLWIGGYVLHRFREGRWRIYRSSEIPVPHNYTRLLEASDGALWIAGLGQEAVRLDLGTTRWLTYSGLAFQCEGADGSRWFISRMGEAVRVKGDTWTSYGPADGFMDRPVRLIAGRQGGIWAAGSHQDTAATARFDGLKWTLQIHARFSRGILPQIYEAPDGSIWVAAGGLFSRDEGYMGGVLHFHDGSWTHYPTPEAPFYIYGIARTAGGTMWFGGRELHRFDGQTWMPIEKPEELTSDWSEVLYTAPDGNLWVGSRTYGIFHYNGESWKRYDVQHGLADNRVRSILQTGNGSVWVATPRGVSRFDGQVWLRDAFPFKLKTDQQIELGQSSDGAIWINLYEDIGKPLHTIRYMPDPTPPETEISFFSGEISQPGNAPFSWKGTDLWNVTPREDLMFSYRLNGGEWSPFSRETSHIFQTLPGGEHTFEVKARDRDFNEDPTPARVAFTVIPRVWKQPWFVGLMALLLAAIGFQTWRVIRRDRLLRASNAALSRANQELFDLNRELREKSRALEEANERLKEVDALKTDFFSNVSHELRTPMTAIKGYVDNMLDGIVGSLSESQRHYLDRVRSNADRLTRLINNLLDLSRVDRGRTDLLQLNLARLSLRQAVSDAVETLRPAAEEAGLSLSLEGADAEVMADRDRLVQIVTNLVDNAIKFTPSGGEVSVTVSPDGKGYIQTAVRDTGRGMPAGDVEKVFDRFYQVKGTRGGTGLGLPITKELVALHGGKIWAESEEGAGSTFTFTLPEVRS